MQMFVVVVGLVLFGSSQAQPVDVSCKNEADQKVNWFILYKAPGGVKYVYIDAGGKKDMTSIGDGALAHTLRPMLGSARNMAPSFGFLSYSDQPPGASAKLKEFGHSKGVVLADSSTKTALWITHSTPQFPFRRDQNRFFPESGEAKGQTFMCVSLSYSDLKAVGNHLQNIRAYPFDYDLPIGFPQELRAAADWATSESLLGKFQTLQTKDKKELKIMAKPTGYDAEAGDLYVKLAAGFKSDLNAQTWGCQPNAEESFCNIGEPQVINVEDISTDNKVKWSTTDDHSKWAVTTKQNIAWTCFGDVNRAVSQYERWGGALCINDKKVNEFFRKFVKNPLPCRKRPRPCTDSEMFSQIESLAENIQEKLEL